MKREVKLTRRLTLEEPRRVPDGSGGYSLTWTAVGVLWADVAPRGSREDFIGARARPRIAYRILVRGAPPGAASRPRPDQRFREGARVLEILTVAEFDPEARYLEILAEEGLPA